MKIITWNVRAGNKKLPKLLTHVMRHQPDVVCLQEVPRHALALLRHIRSYTLTHVHDMKSDATRRDRFTCVLTKLPPQNVQRVYYGTHEKASLWSNIVYHVINQFRECHIALVVELPFNGTIVRIITARLSMAIGTHARIRQFETLVTNLDRHAVNIICGDLNIIDSRILNIASGWARGFTRADYFTNERRAFEQLCTQYGFDNIFHGISTWLFMLPRLQFDHILVPKGTPVHHKTVSPIRCGSDHRMVSADIVI